MSFNDESFTFEGWDEQWDLVWDGIDVEALLSNMSPASVPQLQSPVSEPQLHRNMKKYSLPLPQLQSPVSVPQPQSPVSEPQPHRNMKKYSLPPPQRRSTRKRKRPNFMESLYYTGEHGHKLVG
tara:strand:- start:179 stop:550 length:372 start_codon:yes stop_codon:yes gene_type:complete